MVVELYCWSFKSSLFKATAPFRVLLIEDLCDTLSENFPDMWKLSQAYFGGELLPSTAHVDHSKHPECKVSFSFLY